MKMVKGKNTHRLASNPLEQAFAKAWERQNRQSGTLEYIMSAGDNNPREVDEESQVVAATVIQWLGSPVGQHFLEEVLGFDVRDQIPDHLRVR
jgi:hypothetical protein